MFGKLLKHEFRATGRVIPWVMAAAFLMTGLSYLIYLLGDQLTLIRVMLCFILLICLLVVPIVTYVLLVLDFYKTSYGSQAYLTRCLPVSQAAVYNSKFVVHLVWMFLSSIVSVLMVGALILLIVSFFQEDPALVDIFSALAEELPLKGFATMFILYGVMAVFQVVQMVVLYQFCICAGHLGPFRKLGLGGPFLIYAIYYIAGQIFSVLFMLIPLSLSITLDGGLQFNFTPYFSVLMDSTLTALPLLSLIWPIILSVVGYIFNRRWFANNINLK